LLRPNELTTIRAALRYWRDEMTSTSADTAYPYYDDMPAEQPLSTSDVARLIECFQPREIKCVLISPDDFVLSVTQKPETSPGPNRFGTLVLGPEPPSV